jgi:predicted Rossmann fold flavoprotein
MNKVIIIGGGASGLVAGIVAARNKASVTILERNNTCGKKLLLTGNGKCNYLNEDLDNKHFHSNEEVILNKILTDGNKQKVIDFWKSLNIVSKNKNGYIYPNSNQSSTILDALLNELKQLNVQIETNTYVSEIKQINNEFLITTNKGLFKSDKLIITAGSCAAPKTGSDGIGYKLAKSFNHTIIKPLPALVQLETRGNYLDKWSGIREDVNLKLYENNQLIKEESGEIQLTNYGISGICVMQLSSFVARSIDNNKNEVITINLLPMFKSKKDLIDFINQDNLNVFDTLCKTLNKKLIGVIIDLSKIKKEDKFEQLTKDKQNLLIDNLTEFKVNIIKTKGFEEAQVASGGISLKEINYLNMESKITKNLYFGGEILDVNGDCGGYNLTFATLSGILAGESNDKN